VWNIACVVAPGASSAVIPSRELATTAVPAAVPSGRRRKKQVLESVAAQKQPRKPPARNVAPLADVPATPVDDLFFVKVKHTCTKEVNARFQICAFVDDGGTNRRIHICTLTRFSWGQSFQRDGIKIVKFCESEHATKALVLAYKDSMKTPVLLD
jgi:hypothetical protein